MKIQIHSDELKKVFTSLFSEDYLIEVKDGIIVHSYYEGALLKKRFACTTEGVGSFVIGKTFSDFIGTLSDMLSITVKDNKAEVKTSKGKHKFPTKDPLAYPIINIPTSTHSVKIEATDLSEALRRCQYFHSQGPLSGLLIKCSKDLAFVSTNKYILVEYVVEGDFGEAEVVVPSSFLKYLKFEGEVTILFSSVVTFVTKDFIASFPTLDTEYPNYKKFDLETDKRMTVNRKDLVASLQRAMILSPMFSYCKLVFEDNLAVEVETESGQMKEVLDYEGDRTTLFINARQLKQILDSLPNDNITLHSNNRFVILRDKGYILNNQLRGTNG